MGVGGALSPVVRSARAWTVVWVVFESLLVVSPSAVPPELTEGSEERRVGTDSGAPTLTWLVNTDVPPTARVTLRVQVTTRRAALHALLGPVGWKVVPVGRVSEALRLPVWDEGPLLVTVRV